MLIFVRHSRHSVKTWSFLNARIDSVTVTVIKDIHSNQNFQNTTKERSTSRGHYITKLFTLALEEIVKKIDWEPKGSNIIGLKTNINKTKIMSPTYIQLSLQRDY